MSLITKYQKEILPELKKEFDLKNDLAAPRIEKIVLNAGVADTAGQSAQIEKVQEQLAVISGQKPKITKAKRSISSFKLRAKDPIGVAVTLRGQKAWQFLERFVTIVMPRMRDFRGLPKDKFDRFGNYNLGIPEQILFPEIDYSKIDKIRGLVVTFVIKNSNPAKSEKLMEMLGAKFRTN